MRFGVVIPTYGRFGDPDALRRLVDQAEAVGFDSAWFGDHVVVPGYAAGPTDPHWYEALTCAFHAIGHTTRLQFGTDVVVLPCREPLLLAKMAATASLLSGGRFALGLGVGFLRGEFEALGAPPFGERGAVADEYLEVMRLALSTAGPASFDGRWVRFEDVCFGPVPAQPPPLIVGGNHDRAIARAARLGDGWHPLWPTPERYAEGRARILDARRAAGIDRPFRFSYSCPHTVLLDDDGAAAPVAAHHSGDLGPDYAYVPALPHAEDGRVRFVGTAEQLRDDVAAFAAAGVEQLVVRLWIPSDAELTLDGHLELMRRFMDEVGVASRAHTSL
jgi:probable F420-dependent oxidoreductase